MPRTLIVVTMLFAASFAVSSYMLVDARARSGAEAETASAAFTPSASASGIVLYVGDGCPHCALVEKYLNENGAASKLSYQTKEVFHDKANAAELVGRAKACNLKTDSVGVPFLWDGAKCYVGDVEVKAFFETKLASK